jgi:hypothetical protein
MMKEHVVTLPGWRGLGVITERKPIRSWRASITSS